VAGSIGYVLETKTVTASPVDAVVGPPQKPAASSRRCAEGVKVVVRKAEARERLEMRGVLRSAAPTLAVERGTRHRADARAAVVKGMRMRPATLGTVATDPKSALRLS